MVAIGSTCGIPHLDLGGPGPVLHFAHANGYPVEAYGAVLRRLDGFRVLGMNQRMLWPGSNPRRLSDWKPLAADLVRFLESCARPPVLGVGHSMGGVATAQACLMRPELFAALVLIDPVFLPPRITRYWGWMKRLGLGHRMPLSKIARKRRTTFESREIALDRFRRVPLFSRMRRRGAGRLRGRLPGAGRGRAAPALPARVGGEDLRDLAPRPLARG